MSYPLGRDTDATVRCRELTRTLIRPAPRLFAGEVPRKSFDLTKFRNPRYRNQWIGSCVGQSGAAMGETTMRTPEPLTAASVPRPGLDLSPLWVYQIARQKSRELGVRLVGEGAIVTHALLAVKEKGLIPWDAWPCTQETERAYRDGTTPEKARTAPRYMPIKDVRELQSADQILEYLAGGYSVWVGSSWRGSMRTDATGYFAWGGRSVGGHAVELLGYDKDADRIWIGNSWDGWGLKGSLGWTKMSAYLAEFSDRAISSGQSEAVVFTELDGWRPRARPGDWGKIFV